MYGTYQRLQLSVFAKQTTVIRAARAKLTKKYQRDPSKRADRKTFYKIMLDYHREAMDTYLSVVRG